MKYSIRGKNPQPVEFKELIPVSALLRLCIGITPDGRRIPVLMDSHTQLATVDPEVPYLKVQVEDGQGLLTKP
jgi:hypothetical protein